jgi:hypothetical protein
VCVCVCARTCVCVCVCVCGECRLIVCVGGAGSAQAHHPVSHLDSCPAPLATALKLSVSWLTHSQETLSLVTSFVAPSPRQHHMVELLLSLRTVW